MIYFRRAEFHGLGGVSTLDSAQSRRELSAQFRDTDEHTARVQWLVAEIFRCIEAEIMDKPLFFVPGNPTAKQVIAQGLDYDDLSDQMAELLNDAADGHRTQGTASELRRMAVERFAQGVTK